MGIFWTYFRDKLLFPIIAQPGPLAILAEGGADALDEARDDVLWLRDQFCTARCDQEQLEAHAKSRGIVRGLEETDEHYYGRIRFAYLWYINGGRALALEETLKKYFGFGGVKVISLRGSDPDRWAEFDVEIEVLGSDLEVNQSQIVWAIAEMKPARSKLNEARFTYSSQGDVPVYAVAMITGAVIEVEPQQ